MYLHVDWILKHHSIGQSCSFNLKTYPLLPLEIFLLFLFDHFFLSTLTFSEHLLVEY